MLCIYHIRAKGWIKRGKGNGFLFLNRQMAIMRLRDLLKMEHQSWYFITLGWLLQKRKHKEIGPTCRWQGLLFNTYSLIKFKKLLLDYQYQIICWPIECYLLRVSEAIFLHIMSQNVVGGKTLSQVGKEGSLDSFSLNLTYVNLNKPSSLGLRLIILNAVWQN